MQWRLQCPSLLSLSLRVSKTFLLLVFLQSSACALNDSSSSSPTRKPWRLYADDCLIKVTAHRSLNSSIRCPDLAGMSEVDIRSKMASQGVFAVQRVSLEKDGKSVTTNTLFQTTLCLLKITDITVHSFSVALLQLSVLWS